jgi:hypothetical protein
MVVEDGFIGNLCLRGKKGLDVMAGDFLNW